MIEHDYSNEILNTEEFKLMRQFQSCSHGVVHENDQVLLNGVFYNYGDNSEEMRKYRQEQKENFVKSISKIILERYPNLNEEQIRQIAFRCSAHSQEKQEDILLDIDICALQLFEEKQLDDNIKRCLEKIKESTEKTQDKQLSIESDSYSEEYAKYFVLTKLYKHMQNNNEPLLTWGEGRLVAEMNAEFVKQKKSSMIF